MLRGFSAALAALWLSACAVQPRPAAIAPAQPVEVQILAINDFHGNLETPRDPPTITLSNGTEVKRRVGGAAALAATLNRLRTGHRYTVTVSAGDLIGASPFASAHFLDEPTIHAMNQLGLAVNAVGNHEFDRGSAELRRMQIGGCEKHTQRKPCAVEPFHGARFRFLAANVRDAGGRTLFPATTVVRQHGIDIGFVGMTLKETATLVTPAGVAGLSFTDEADAANEAARGLKAAGADAIVLLIHQGGKTPKTFRDSGCEGLAGGILGIMDRLDPGIPVVVSGHTHYAYTCELQRGGASRLLTSAGRYGYMVTDIRLAFDPSTKALLSKAARNVPVAPDLGEDAGVAALVTRYAAAAAPEAARVVGKLRGPAPHSDLDDETPAANLIADAQLAASRAAGKGGAQVAFMNGGGVRTGLVPDAAGNVTYGQVFEMQPFGNGLVVMTLTGEQIRRMLEQQFQADSYAPGAQPALMVPSAGFRFDYDLSRPNGQRIVAATLDGKPLDPAANYRVTVNSFLASGGDGYTVLTEGGDRVDAGLDLDALEAWLATNPAVPTPGRTRNLTPR